MFDDLFEGLGDLEELGREQEAIAVGEDPLSSEWRRLMEISTRIAGELQTDTLLHAVMDAAIEITGAERGFLILLTANGEPEVRIAHNLAHEEIQDIKGSISTTLIEKVLFERKPILVNDVENNALLSRQVSVRNLQLKSVMGAPIICREQPLGMAYVDNSSLAGIFSQKEFAIFVTFVNLAAVAIDNARLFDSLREKSEQYRSLQEYNENILRTVPSGLLVLNKENKIEYYNRAARTVCPWIKNEKTLTIKDIPHDAIQKGVTGMHQGLTPKTIPLSVEGRFYEVNFFPVLSREGKIGLMIADVTDRKKLERQYYDEEKRALMTQLAGGIAHEISNHLFPIQGRAQLLTMKMHAASEILDPDIPKSLQIIEEQVQKVARIVENLRNLSKPADPQFRHVDVTAVLMQAVEIMSSTAGKIKRFRMDDENAPFHLKTYYHPRPLIVQGDPDQLQQVFMNLIINAAHAMEEMGKGELSLGTLIEDGKAVIFVQDTGPGIPESVRERVFEPYFTTKGQGKGTGLGLPIVKNIIQLHEGELRLQTEIGKGTRFQIHLPLVNPTTVGAD